MTDEVECAPFTPEQEARIRELIREQLGPPIFVVRMPGPGGEEDVMRALADAMAHASGRPMPAGPAASVQPPAEAVAEVVSRRLQEPGSTPGRFDD